MLLLRLAGRRDSSETADGLALLGGRYLGAQMTCRPKFLFVYMPVSAMLPWIDKLSFSMRVVLTILVVAITVGVIVWDLI
jgi:hypothetical protein